jgi:hypothetical protein
VVAQGENLQIIARNHGVPVQDIIDANRIEDPGIIQPKTVLVIPKSRESGKSTKPKSSKYTVRKGDTIWGISRQFDGHQRLMREQALTHRPAQARRKLTIPINKYPPPPRVPDAVPCRTKRVNAHAWHYIGYPCRGVRRLFLHFDGLRDGLNPKSPGINLTASGERSESLAGGEQGTILHYDGDV